MKIKYQDYQQFIDKLQQHINLLLAFPLVAFIFLFIKIENKEYSPEFLSDIYLFLFRNVSLIFILIIILIGYFKFSRSVRIATGLSSLRMKLDLYYHAAMIRSFFYLSATLLSLLGMSLTGEKIYAAFYALSLVAFSISYPNQTRLIRNLKLTGGEKDKILQREVID